jgi:DNA helicase-2/ATP-dependent DNA helicase PcrA
LRLIENPSDDVACERIINRPPRGIGEGTVAKLRKHAAQWGGSLLDAARQADRVTGLSGRAKKAVSGFADLIGRLQEQSASGRVAPLLERLLAEIDYLSLWREDSDDVDVDRAANVFELVAAARLYDASAEAPDAIADPPSLQGFLELATLSNEADNVDPARGAVTLMTLHASKGLEFPCVWIIGLEQGLIPHERAVRDGNPASFEEERRLLFVGITRAQQQLTLTQASERVFRGQRRTSISSPFLPELNGTFQQHASIETPPAITAALLDERIEQARRRFHAARREPDRPLIVTASELAARQAAARPNVASDSTSTTEASDSTAAEPASTTPPSLLNIQRVDTAHGAADSDATDELRSPFRPGMLVRHPQYGRGTVTACSGMSNRRTVTVCFDNSNEPKTFVAAHCPLQPAGPPIDF